MELLPLGNALIFLHAGWSLLLRVMSFNELSFAGYGRKGLFTNKGPILKPSINHPPFKTGLLVGQGGVSPHGVLIMEGVPFSQSSWWPPFMLPGWAVYSDTYLKETLPASHEEVGGGFISESGVPLTCVWVSQGTVHLCDQTAGDLFNMLIRVPTLASK